MEIELQTGKEIGMETELQTETSAPLGHQPFTRSPVLKWCRELLIL